MPTTEACLAPGIEHRSTRSKKIIDEKAQLDNEANERERRLAIREIRWTALKKSESALDLDPGQTQDQRLAGVVVTMMPVVVDGGTDPHAFKMAPPATDQARLLHWDRVLCLRSADSWRSDWHCHGGLVEPCSKQQGRHRKVQSKAFRMANPPSG